MKQHTKGNIALILTTVVVMIVGVAILQKYKISVKKTPKPTTTLETIIHEERGVICFYLQGPHTKEGLSCLPLERNNNGDTRSNTSTDTE